MTVERLVAPNRVGKPMVRPAYFAWAALAIGVMITAIISGQAWFLNFIHVMSGVLWTGIDLFLGFVLGPILRRAPMEAKRPIVIALVPRTLILMPVLSILTTTTGWFLAKQMGYLDVPYPGFFGLPHRLSS